MEFPAKKKTVNRRVLTSVSKLRRRKVESLNKHAVSCGREYGRTCLRGENKNGELGDTSGGGHFQPARK
jgi:hypothetical protein